MKRTWHYFLVEPFTWLFYCFFQPTRFEREIEIQGFWKRIRQMFRLALPIFLVSYPLGLIVRVALLGNYSVKDVFILSSTAIGYFLLITAGITIFGIISGFSLGIAASTTVAITLAIGGGIVGDIPFGIAGGITKFATSGLLALLTLGILGFLAGNDAGGILVGLRVGTIVPLTIGLATFVAERLEIATTFSTANIITEDIVLGIVLGIVLSTMLSFRRGAVLGIILLIAGFLTGDILRSIVSGSIFLLSYTLGYYRLPLYPLSGLVECWAYLASRKAPTEVFTYLHRSSLYWDECVSLPLLGLKDILLIAIAQDIERAQEEIKFIMTQRPKQIRAAQAAWLEIVMRNLEICEDLYDISKVSTQLAEILPREERRIASRQVTPLARLNDVSRDVARYYNLRNRQERREALENAITTLKSLSLYLDTRDSDFSKRLSELVEKWLVATQRKVEELENAAQEIGQIDNPYNPGQALKLRDSLFVGRSDLKQQLEEVLSKKDHRPTLFLNGERRMGKTSTLMQLPDLLGARYIPVYYDLQSPGRFRSTAAFLDAIAKGIYEGMSARGIQLKKLEYERLREAGQENEAAVYHEFDKWLERVEIALEQEDRTLLLTFDEFEKLIEASQTKRLNFDMLLNWFRSVIQHRTHLVLLFSGLRTASELDKKWADYFVNAQILSVSFLQTEEAYQLITRPVENFPGEYIFEKEVVDEIMRITGCHPFLVQAICSELICFLNLVKRDRAIVQDVAVGMNQVLERWPDYFQNLWNRTDEAQQTCLVALVSLSRGTIHDIEQQSNLDEPTVRRALQILRKRDLVLLEYGHYQIVAPIFCVWVMLNSDQFIAK